MHVNKTPKENVKHGKLTIHDDGTYTYIPEQYFNGKDYFIYELIDEGTPHKCCFARVDITVTAVNNKPVAGNDVGTVNEDGLLSGINLLANDSDIETGVKIKTKPVKDVEHGKLKIFENGTFTYKPDENFYGTDEFIYEISDIGEPVLYATAKVTIQVLPVNDQPIAYSTEITVKENSIENRIEIDNPSDIDGDELSITIISVVEYGKVLLPNGTVLDQGMKISTDELVNLSYTTQEKTVGEVQFKYEVSDKASEVSQGVVKITIEPADVFIPEAITPNGDGFNDKFVIIGLENYPENSLRIFNRWGNLVYRKSNYDNSWEGYGNVRGQLSNDRLPPGTYYYHFKADKASIRKSGYIYLTY